ncbi:glycosyltransferase family 4 protein [bacterium]|nr:glycosyltransferase family 4 protein [bacterium]
MPVDPIRNLQVISSPGVGGREIDVPVLARKLISQGHPTWVMCRPNTLVTQLAQDWNLPHEPTHMRGYLDPINIVALASWLRQKKIEIIHAHWSRDLSNLILASGLAGNIPVVLTKHVYATENKHDLFHAWVYRHTDIVIAISHLVAENVHQTVRVPWHKIITIYNGLELNHQWNPEITGDFDRRTNLEVPAGSPVLGYVGRLNRGKRPGLVMEAFARLSGRFPDWHFVLAGKAVGRSEELYAEGLKQMARDLGLAARIHFVGYQKDMPAVMHSFNILACASEFESLGMVMIEAMAMQRPVVGPDSGGVPEIIEPGKNGEIFRSGDIDDLTEKLGGLMADPDRCKKMGSIGREIVKRKFNLDLMAEQVAGVFQKVLGMRRMKSGR